MKLVLFLLYGGFLHFTFASNRLRIFNTTTFKDHIWDDSLKKCQEKNESLVTLYDEEDANFTLNYVTKVDSDDAAWLGLRRNRSLRTTWSNNNTVIFRNFTENVTDGEQRCVAIVNDTWTYFNCSDKKPFMCYEGKNYTLIENENKSWCQALQYCRKHFNNLVSISDQDQNQAVIKEGKNKTFWIGLMYDAWKWADNGCSSYREWKDLTLNKNCTYCSKNNHPLSLRGCGMVVDILLCSKGSVRIKVIQQKLTWEEAFNYCEANHTRLLEIRDELDQKAVEQWLNTIEVLGPFWIALRQSRVFGFWIWSDRAVTLNKWKEGHAPEMPLSQHCGVIERDDDNDHNEYSDYKWSDKNCLHPLPFLCEEDIIYM